MTFCLCVFQIFLSFAREQTDGAHIEGSDSSSSSGGESDSALGTSSVTNPYYAHFNRPLELESSGKGEPDSGVKKSPYILPVKDGLEVDTDSYSTKL